MLRGSFDTRDVDRKLNKLKRNLRNPKNVMKEIGDNEVKAAQFRIRVTKTTPDGERWTPWSYATLQSRIRNGNVARGLLWVSGLLHNSFKVIAHRRDVSISNEAPHAQYIQNGTSNMPARPFMGWGKETERSNERTFKRFFEKVLK